MVRELIFSVVTFVKAVEEFVEAITRRNHNY